MMDDECVEELGRPISSLKVSELRDELAKRALIKTGKKNELVDRLRQAISKQSTKIQQSVADQPADLTVQPANLQLTESAIDYSTQQTQNQNMTPNQEAVELAAQDVVDFSSSNTGLQLESETTESPVKNTHDDISKSVPNQNVEIEHDNVVTSEQTHDNVSAQSEQKDMQDDSSKQSYAEIKTDEDKKTDDSLEYVEDQSKTDILQEKNEISGVVDHSSRDESGRSVELEAAPVVFTIKRGNRDNQNASKMEKRRKWSGRTDSSQNSEPSPLVSGGISSQKLQELIDFKQSTSSEPETKEDLQKNESDRKIGPMSDSKRERSEKPIAKDAAKDSEEAQTEALVEEEKTRPEVSLSKSELDSQSEEKITEPTRWLIVKNLMRPYTVTQLKEELCKFGPIVEEKLWTDRIKSKCCVLYESVEAAQKTREYMQGQHWPATNPKSLVVEYITEEIYKNHIAADTNPQSQNKRDTSRNEAVNGGAEKNNKKSNDRLGNRLDAAEVGGSSIRSRLGEKVGGDAMVSNSVDLNRFNSIDSQELDDFFRKTKAKPQLFWLPLDENQAAARAPDREERDRKAQEASKNASSSHRLLPHLAKRRRSPIRHSPPRPGLGRQRSPARRSPVRRRSPIRRRTPPITTRRSPARRRPPPSPRDSPPPRRRSPPRNPSPLLRRRPSPRDPSPPTRRRSPYRDSPPFRRRAPLRDSPPPRRRSPSPLLRRRSPPRDSPPIRRRSPEPGRRSPAGYNRRSPDIMRRSPGLIRRVSPGRRSPISMRSPVMMRRSPGPIRRSPGLMRRSPGPIQRSPGQVRRSPGTLRRSPPIRRARGAREYD